MTILELLNSKEAILLCQSTPEQASGGKSCPKKKVSVEKRGVSTTSKRVFNEEGSGGVEQLQFK